MTQEHVAIARKVCDAAWLRPRPDYDTLNALVHPDHEMATVQSLVEGGVYRGARGFQRWLASWEELFGEDWECRVEDAEEIDSEQVLVTASASVRGKGGGVPVEQRFWAVVTVHGGKVSRSEIHTDRRQALEAAGQNPRIT